MPLSFLLSLTATIKRTKVNGSERVKHTRHKIIDSSTICLFSDILLGVGRNTKDGSRNKGSIKVHTMIGAFSVVAESVRMTEANVHDRKLLYQLTLPANSFIVFD